ncbi:hypothetical protein D3C75_850890 [compost metagenome]
MTVTIDFTEPGFSFGGLLHGWLYLDALIRLQLGSVICGQHSGLAFLQVDEKDRFQVMLLSFILEIKLNRCSRLLVFVQSLLGMCRIHIFIDILGGGSQNLVDLRHDIAVDGIDGYEIKAGT